MATTEDRSAASTPGALVRLACVAPPLVLIGATAVMLVMGAGGRHPFWDEPPVTVCEAAIMRDAAEVLRLLRVGADPNARCQVRPGLLGPQERSASPLEAAIRARQTSVVEILLAEGARPDPQALALAQCLEAEEAVELRALLSPFASSGAPIACAGGLPAS
jgi:hypothetical protein